MIDQYSGAYRVPDSTQMDDDAYDDAKKKADENDPTQPSDDPGGDSGTEPDADGIVQVGSWEDFLDAFYGAYYSTSEYLEFELVNNFTLDMSDALQESYNELQRRDPVYVCSVARWIWGHRGSEYLIEIEYNMDIDEIKRIKTATQDYLDDALEQIDGTMSDYEIVCAVNDYLCDTVVYPEQEPYAPITHTAYGALANGSAVCEGYACAAKLMLDALGIPCDIQFGVCHNGGGHAWNLVQLEGRWYQMDITWNDGSLSRSDYLLVTDDYMRQSRSWDEGDYPACAVNPYTP
jgi:transglutaminase-like putative cysteine protease